MQDAMSFTDSTERVLPAVLEVRSSSRAARRQIVAILSGKNLVVNSFLGIPPRRLGLETRDGVLDRR